MKGFNAGNVVTTAKYKRIGKTIHVRGRLQFGSTTTVTGTVLLGLPVPGIGYAAHDAIGSAVLYDASAGSSSRTAATLTMEGAADQHWAFLIIATGSTVDVGRPWAWAVGDLITFTATYETA